MKQLPAKEKNCLSNRLAETLRGKIRNGEWFSGMRLPGERMLAEELDVSRTTVVNALNILMQEGMIDKIPACGNFVAGYRPPQKVAIIYPDLFNNALDLPERDYTRWAMLRGIFSEAAKHGITPVLVALKQMVDHNDLFQTIRKLEEYDVLIFDDNNENNRPIKKHFYGKKRIFQSLQTPALTEDDFRFNNLVGYDREQAFRLLAAEIRKRNLPPVVVLNCSFGESLFWLEEKAAEFSRIMQQEKIPFDGIITVNSDQAASVLPQIAGKTVFFSSTDHIGLFYRICSEKNVTPGEDFKLVMLCSGGSVNMLSPKPAYLRIPFFEEGEEFIRSSIRMLNLRKPVDETQTIYIPVELICNETL